MGGVAGQTILHGRRMLPQKGASRVGVALEAFLVDCLRVDQFVGNSAVGVVTIRATHFTFSNGVVGLPQHLGANIFVTFDASRILSLFNEIIRIVPMNIMATGAGQVPALMAAAVPQRLLAFGVALQA